MSPDAKQIQLSASSRGITDYFFCFVCDEHVWDCDHLIDTRLFQPNTPALEQSQLQSFAYDGRVRVLEIEFRVNPPHAYGDIPLPPPPRVIQYAEVPRYIYRKLMTCRSARAQERYWEEIIQRRFKAQTVRTVCRLPRIYRFSEARNIQRHSFEEYLQRATTEEPNSLRVVVPAMKILLVRRLAPKHVAGLGGLLECPSCGSIGPTTMSIRHRNCLWSHLATAKNLA